MVMSRGNNRNLEELPVRESGVKKRCTIKKACKQVDNSLGNDDGDIKENGKNSKRVE